MSEVAMDEHVISPQYWRCRQLRHLVSVRIPRVHLLGVSQSALRVRDPFSMISRASRPTFCGLCSHGLPIILPLVQMLHHARNEPFQAHFASQCFRMSSMYQDIRHQVDNIFNTGVRSVSDTGNELQNQY